VSDVRPTGGATSLGGDPTQPAQPDKSLGQLLGELTGELTDLVRKELQLAQVEIKEEVRQAGKGGGFLGGAGVAGFLALILLSFALAWGLAELMPEGFAFLIVGVLWAIVAAVLASRGRKELKEVQPVPRQTMETLKEDAQWARDLKS
jgi:uncharacterized membrane protein YqjE